MQSYFERREEKRRGEKRAEEEQLELFGFGSSSTTYEVALFSYFKTFFVYPHVASKYSLLISTLMTPYTPGSGQIHHTKLNSHRSQEPLMALSSASQSNLVFS